MFVAFKGDPIILRLYGRSQVVPRARVDSKLLSSFGKDFVEHPAFRAVMLVDVERVQSSCGYSIPFYDYVRGLSLVMLMLIISSKRHV